MSERPVLKRILALAAAILTTGLLLLHSCPASASATSGTVANLVLMVRFAGDADSTDVFANNWTEGSRIRDMYEKTDGAQNASLKRYLSIISDGQLTVNNYFPQEQSGAVESFVLDGALSDYGSDTDIVRAAVAKLEASGLGAGAAVLDNRDPGYLDNLTVLVQGSPTDSASIIYPHKANYGGGLTALGKVVTTYNIIDSTSLTTDTLMRQGVICHEFMHSLGLPDLYRYSSAGEPVGSWDLMGGASIFLQYLLSYSRQQMGWLSMDTIDADSDPDTTYTLDWVGTAGGRRGYIIRSPLSSTEFFVVEYRRAFERSDPGYADYIQNPPIDFKAPGTGLIVYRVNPGVTGQTNAQGNNYIYIFRPNVTDADNDGDSKTAAIDPAAVSSYGSTDLSAAFTANTFYYSGSQHLNSGIELDSITANENGTVSFKVKFADYDSEDLWDAVGGNVADEASRASCAVDGSGVVYGAYEVNNTSLVKKYSEGVWTAVGSSVNIYDPQLVYKNGELYLLGSDGAAVKCYRLNSGVWTSVYSGSFPNSTQVRYVNSSDGLYASFYASNILYIINLSDQTAQPISQSTPPLRPGGALYNVSVCLLNGSFYASYLDQTSTGLCRAARLTVSGWEDMNLPSNTNKSTELAADGANLLLLTGREGQAPTLYTYNGIQWSSESIAALSNSFEVFLAMAGAAPCVGGITWDADSIATVYQRGSDGWAQVGGAVSSGVSHMSLSYYGGKLYASTVDSSSAATVRSKAASSLPTPPPSADDDYTVSVTPPSGYDDTRLWIDGVSYQAESADGALSVTLANGSAKTAIMYKYNGDGVPTGMYVWALSFADHRYTAAGLPALQDLLSYHGYSIRVSGVPGIRFKSGISSALRGSLLSPGGAAGYTLVNYGTLFTNNAYLSELPFVYGGERIGSGFAYWKEGGRVNDRIFETVQGRYRFTSVIIGVPDTQFNVQFAFRSFITLSKGGEQVILYGPVVSRSIVTVANQVLAAGEFAQGSAGDRYVRDIIAAAASNP